MKLLALDLGDRRIGLASGDTAWGTALPAGYIRRTRLAADIAAVLRAAAQRQADGIVAGIPRSVPTPGLTPGRDGDAAGNGGGNPNRQERQARGFLRALRKATALPVYEVDEAYTSVEAEALLRESGVQPSRERGAVDAAAAVLILRRFLDAPPGNPPG